MAFSQDMLFIEKAAEQGEAKAQYLLGTWYLGQNLNETAFKWFQKAAEQGDINAQSKLGCHYLTGQGTTEDKVKALEWFSKAAEKEEVRAQFYMGLLSNDDTKAKEWYRKAAKQGDKDAQHELSLLEKKESEQKEREEKERREREHQRWLASDDGKNWQRQLDEKTAELKLNIVPEKKKGVLGVIFKVFFVLYIAVVVLSFLGSLLGGGDIANMLLGYVVLSPAAIPYIIWSVVTNNKRKKKEKIYEQIKAAYDNVLTGYKEAKNAYIKNL